jgi:ketosteroid isomerase-like protein
MVDGPVDEYYEALDTHAYDLFERLLTPSFVHERPDRTIDGRERFVEFMTEDRPLTETAHELETVLSDGGTVAVEGRLLDDDDTELFGFVDTHLLDTTGDRIERIRTYTR